MTRQQDFNLDHLDPREYGEVDFYVVADSYTKQQAADIIGQWESDLTGEKHSYSADDIIQVPIVRGKNEDGEEDWCTHPNADKQDIVAWGKAVAL